jgi:hypothetical protein
VQVPDRGAEQSSPERFRYPGSPHLRHRAANVRGYGGAQEKKDNAKSDDEWDLPHDRPPY